MPDPVVSLGVFKQISNAGGTDVVQFAENGKNELKTGGTYHWYNFIGRLMRSAESAEANNEIRTELLRSLAAALNIGVDKNGNVEQLTEKTVNDIKIALGADVFASEDGSEFKLDSKGRVCSGSPLTERRITAIINRLENRKTLRLSETALLQLAGVKNEDRKTLSGIISAQHQKKVDFVRRYVKSFQKLGALPGTDSNDWFFEAVKKAWPELWGLDIAASRNAHDSFMIWLRAAAGNVTEALKDPEKNAEGLFSALSLLNEEAQTVYNKVKPGRTANVVSAKDFLDKLSSPSEPKLSEPKLKEANNEDVRLSGETFAAMVKNVMFKPQNTLFGELVKHVSDSMVSAKRNLPNTFDAFKGVALVFKDFDTKPKVSGLKGFELTENGTMLMKGLTKGVLGLFAEEPELTVDEKNKLWDNVFMPLMSNVQKGSNEKDSIATEEGLVKMFAEKFNDANIRGVKIEGKHAKDAIRLAMSAIRDLQFPKNEDGKNMACEQIVLAGGGMFKTTKTYEFKVGTQAQEFTSKFEPVDRTLNPGTDKLTPVTNLGVSSMMLKDNNKTLVKFLRFGQVSLREFKSEIGKLDEKRASDYKALARAVLMNNPYLFDKARTSNVVEVPIYRIDLCSSTECLLREPNGGVQSFKMKLDDGHTVTIEPKVHHFQMPFDSPPDKDKTILDAGDLSRTIDELGKLLAYAKEKVSYPKDSKENLEADSKEKLEACLLIKTLEDFKSVLEEYGKSDKGLLATTPGIGPQLLRFGAQVATLLSLIGETPAINCNWGRDRTTEMDSEIKRTVWRLGTRQTVNNNGIYSFKDQKRTEDYFSVKYGFQKNKPKEKKERTSFLFWTGNAMMAKRMNLTQGQVNVNQARKHPNNSSPGSSLTGITEAFDVDDKSKFLARYGSMVKEVSDDK